MGVVGVSNRDYPIFVQLSSLRQNSGIALDRRYARTQGLRSIKRYARTQGLPVSLSVAILAHCAWYHEPNWLEVMTAVVLPLGAGVGVFPPYPAM